MFGKAIDDKPPNCAACRFNFKTVTQSGSGTSVEFDNGQIDVTGLGGAINNRRIANDGQR